MSFCTATFTDTEERMYSRQGEGFTRELSWRKNPLGTWFLEILNCDLEELEALIRANSPADPWKDRREHDAPFIIEPPTKGTFEHITQKFDFISAYLPFVIVSSIV